MRFSPASRLDANRSQKERFGNWALPGSYPSHPHTQFRNRAKVPDSLGSERKANVIRRNQSSPAEGVITVESQPGHGAVFSAYLPAVLVDDRSPTVVAEKGVVPENPDAAASLQILYLDDDNTVWLFLKRLLERLTHKFTCFAEPREALAALQNAPDFFIL